MGESGWGPVHVAYAVRWHEDGGDNWGISRDRESAERTERLCREDATLVSGVEEVDVAGLIVDEIEEVRTRHGLVPAAEQNAERMSWPVWVVQVEDASGDRFEWAAESRAVAESDAETAGERGEGVPVGVFLLDAWDAIHAGVGRLASARSGTGA